MSEHQARFIETGHGVMVSCSCGDWMAYARAGHGIDHMREAQQLYRRHVTNVGWRA